MMVQCVKLNELLPGLPHPPFKGELGERIWRSISEKAWKGWLGQSTMIINEYRLNPSEAEARDVLRRELEKYLFGGGSAPPSGYVKPAEDGPKS